jgi:cell division protein ZapA
MPEKPAPDKSASNSEATAAARAISVDIYDQTYHLHGHDPEYVRRLAHIIDSKMRAVAAQGKTVDSLRVAVLAALNVADELVMLEEKYEALTTNLTTSQGSIRTRAHSLAGLIDSVLDTGT